MKIKTSYLFVSGGVLSGVGKGIVTASVALLLKSRGYKVTVVKCENYLNLDAGLINPIEHGDPFLCDDGAETDMDIGTYEKFLDQNLSLDNFITMGQIYKRVIEKERDFDYNGEDVEAIPHVTDEIIHRIKSAGKKDSAEIVIIELGGTAGEYQNVLYYEASRIMKFSLKNPVAHIHVTYLPTPQHLGEPKTKPTQLSVKTLNSMGLHPDMLVARSTKGIDQRRRERLALFCSIPTDHIIDAKDVDSVYELPLIFSKQSFSEKILKLLDIPSKPLKIDKWKNFVAKIKSPKKHSASIAIVGKYFATGEYQLRDSYAALYDALDHAATHHNIDLKIKSVHSEDIAHVKKNIKGVDGIIIPIGWGTRGVEGKIVAIQNARESQIPFLGLCYGMQLASVEFARNVVGLKNAHTVEVDPNTKHPIIHDIPFNKKYQTIKGDGTSMRLGSFDCVLKPNTLAASIYKRHHAFKNEAKFIISERHRHRYEFNNDYRQKLEEKGLVISGTSPDNFFVEVIELPQKSHPFFIATQGHPEYKSRPLDPHPIFLEFLRAASNTKHK